MRAQGKIPSWLKGFPSLLREAGYYTSNNAKTDYNSPIKMREAWSPPGWQNFGRAESFRMKSWSDWARCFWTGISAK